VRNAGCWVRSIPNSEFGIPHLLDVPDTVQSLLDREAWRLDIVLESTTRYWERYEVYRRNYKKSGRRSLGRACPLYLHEAGRRLSGVDRQQTSQGWLGRLEDDHDNLRAAIR